MMNLHQNTSSLQNVIRVQSKIVIFYFIFYLSKTIFSDIWPASISSKDNNNDFIPLAPKDRPKNGAKPSKSGDKSSRPVSEHNSGDDTSSNKDLTVMKPGTV